jgi:hypothetical protein
MLQLQLPIQRRHAPSEWAYEYIPAEFNIYTMAGYSTGLWSDCGARIKKGNDTSQSEISKHLRYLSPLAQSKQFTEHKQ